MGPYSIIYADPPWRMEPWSRKTGLQRAPDAHYETASVTDLGKLPVGDWAAKDAMLCMWVVDLMYPEAMELGKSWGFTYKTVLFRWIKTSNDQLRMFDPTPKPGFGQGRHTRAGACEECWIFGKGKGLKVQRHDIRREFFASKRAHSQKPDEVPGWITDLYGDQPRLEMFARTHRLGWDVWGNETDKFEAT